MKMLDDLHLKILIESLDVTTADHFDCI